MFTTNFYGTDVTLGIFKKTTKNIDSLTALYYSPTSKLHIILRYVIYKWSFRSDGQTYSTADQSLRLESKASFSNGRDVLGYYHSNQLSWSPQEIGFETQLRVYDQGDLVVFTQRFQVIENL